MSEPQLLEPVDADRRRTAATWVAGTGAFLLLVAATVFVAVRWGELPPVAKLLVLVGVTGGVLVAGHRLRRTVPGTGSAVEHLGAFLVPLDVGAVSLHLGARWPGVLLLGGGAAAAIFAALAPTLDSIVLRWATAGAVVAVVAGVAGATPIPAGPVLGALAVLALVLGNARGARTWAAVAGLSPLLVTVPAPLLGGGVLRDFGLAGSGAEWLAVVTGGLSATVFAHQARRLDDPGHAFAAAVSVLLGVATTWLTQVDADPLLAAAGAFLVLELVALSLRGDDLWRPVAHVIAVAAEVLAGVVVPLLACAFVAVLLVWSPSFDGVVMVWFGLLAAGWIAADLRRRRAGSGVAVGLLFGGGWAPGFPLFAVAAVGAGSATGSEVVLGVVLVALVAVAVVSGRPASHPTACVAASFVPVVTIGHGLVAGGLALVAAALAGEIAVLRARAGRRAELPVVAVLVAAGGGAAVAGGASLLGPVLLLLVGWAIGLRLDAASVRLGDGLRAAALALAVLPTSSPREAAVVGFTALGLLAIECVRRRDPRLLDVVALLLPYALLGLLLDAGMSVGRSGVGLALGGVVAAGLAAVVDDGAWRAQLVRIVVVLEVVGLVVAADAAGTFGAALLVAGGVLLGGGLALRRPALVHAGALTAFVGAWIELALAGNDVVEVYAAPVAAYLYVAGLRSRRLGASSWDAYLFPLLLSGGIPLGARMIGGGGGHALAAGAVGVAALVVGGQRRLGAPLVVGTLTCVALAGYEALAVRPTVPTWGWLGLAGSVLLGAGMAIERTGLTPVASGRRLADVVRSDFE